MAQTPLHLAHLSLVLLAVAVTSLPASAQELRNRQLRPAYDFSLIQMPVEMVTISLNGKEIKPGEPITGDDDWLQGVRFTLKNVSDKPIAYVDIGLRFDQPNGVVVYSLNYGVDLSRGERRTESSSPVIEPNQTFDLVLTKEKYEVFLNILARGGAARKFDTALYYIERVCFESEPDMIWEGGKLKRRDPNQFSTFEVVEKYVRPVKPR